MFLRLHDHAKEELGQRIADKDVEQQCDNADGEAEPQNVAGRIDVFAAVHQARMRGGSRCEHRYKDHHRYAHSYWQRIDLHLIAEG